MKNNFKWFIGIDISKSTLDLCLFDGKSILAETKIINAEKSIKKKLKEWHEEFGFLLNEVLLCAEYTGNYIYPLVWGSQSLGVALWLEPGGQIKQSLGILRGKDDKVDAHRIAGYCYRFQDRIRLFTLTDKELIKLKMLITERNGYVIDRAKHAARKKDSKSFMKAADYKKMQMRIQDLIRGLNKCIIEIEKTMNQIVCSHEKYKHQYELLLTVPGVGMHTAIATLVATEGFTRFLDPRKFICHAGIAPFMYTSGTSQRTSARVSNRANKKLKSLLHLGALSAVRINDEFAEYYRRKVAEGKSKMLVLNAIRGKIILRMFAVIKYDRPYQKNYKNDLVLS